MKIEHQFAKLRQLESIMKAALFVEKRAPWYTFPDKQEWLSIDFGILVQLGARCCPLHLTGNFIKPSTHLHTSVFRKKTHCFKLWWNCVSLWLKKNVSTYQSRRTAFDNPLLSDEDHKTLLSVSIDQCSDLNQHVTSICVTQKIQQ